MHKFVGSKAQPKDFVSDAAVTKHLYPPDIQRALSFLGLTCGELTRQTVLDAWKDIMSKPGVHPDTGGDPKKAMYLNTAKDTLLRWIEAQTPKLGKKFGPAAQLERAKSRSEKLSELDSSSGD